MGNLDGKVVFVTGAARAWGAAMRCGWLAKALT